MPGIPRYVMFQSSTVIMTDTFCVVYSATMVSGGIQRAWSSNERRPRSKE
jgi:hypothetical protein